MPTTAGSVNACTTSLGRQHERGTAETHNPSLLLATAHVARGVPAIRSRRRWPTLSGVLAQISVRKRRALVGPDARCAALLNGVGLAARCDPPFNRGGRRQYHQRSHKDENRRCSRG